MYQVLLSAVVVVRNESDRLDAFLSDLGRLLAALASDYEVVLVDNGSNDDSIATLKRLAAAGGVANLQVFALTKQVEPDTANWVGLEKALGDFVVVIDPRLDDPAMIEPMLARALEQNDVVFARNLAGPRYSLAYRVGNAVFGMIYKWFNGVNITTDAPQFRLLSRRAINFLLQHPSPAISYRHLPATAGFSKQILVYRGTPSLIDTRNLGSAIDLGMRLLVSTTRGPMRLVGALSLFGALANLVYSVYVIVVLLFKESVSPGWVTLSLQQSGMFLLLSVVLFVLAEYIVQMVSLSSDGPAYHVGQEFTSAVMTRRQRLNVDDAQRESRLSAPTQ